MVDKLQKMMNLGASLLECKYPILGGAMTWISESNLVSAISNEGAFGILAGGAMMPDKLAEEIKKTKEKTKKTFGVNLILAHPQLHDLIDTCGEQKVSHLFLAGGVLDGEIIKKSHNLGMKCFGFAPSLAISRRLFKIGIDGLVIEGHEAGGHIGPVSTIVLVQEILLNLKGYPIIVAGGIVRGELMASIMQLGAFGCQLGSIFACCKESIAHENFKKAFLSANSRDAIVSVQLDKKFPVIAVRALENEAYRNFMSKQKEALFKLESGEVSLEEARLMLEHFWAGALRRAVLDGDIATGSIMAGQSVGLIKDELSAADIIKKLILEAEEFLNT